MKGQNFASQVLSRHTFRISREKGSDFFDHRGTLKEIKQNELLNFSRPLNAKARIPFGKLQVKANFVFRLFNVSLSFWAQSAKKRCLRFAVLNFGEKLQEVFEIGLKKYGAIVQKSLSKKKYLVKKNSQTKFYYLYLKLGTVQI